MSDRQKQLEVMWNAYQLGQGSADHTDRQAFYEVVGGYLDRIAELEADREQIRAVICRAENRAMAADGAVARTCDEITDEELREIYVLAGGVIPKENSNERR